MDGSGTGVSNAGFEAPIQEALRVGFQVFFIPVSIRGESPRLRGKEASLRMNGYDMNGGMNGTLGDSNAHSGGEEERDDDDGAWKPSTYEPVTDYACEQVVERLSQHGAAAWVC